jgi:hypothetical protein
VQSFPSCSPDVVAPPPGASSPPSPPSLTRFALSRDSLTLRSGSTVPLVLIAEDSIGRAIRALEDTTWVSEQPSVASVSTSGVVLGIAPGTTRVAVSAWYRGVNYHVAILVTVQADPSFPTPVPGFSNAVWGTSTGWIPQVLTVAVGDTVRWYAGAFSWAGVRQRNIWLLDEQYAVVDSIPLVNGRAAMAIDRTRRVRFCSGGCWDPPDFGLIVVSPPQ